MILKRKKREGSIYIPLPLGTYLGMYEADEVMFGTYLERAGKNFPNKKKFL